jgi:hypothetical protein
MCSSPRRVSLNPAGLGICTAGVGIGVAPSSSWLLPSNRSDNRDAELDDFCHLSGIISQELGCSQHVAQDALMVVLLEDC